MHNYDRIVRFESAVASQRMATHEFRSILLLISVHTATVIVLQSLCVCGNDCQGEFFLVIVNAGACRT